VKVFPPVFPQKQRRKRFLRRTHHQGAVPVITTFGQPQRQEEGIGMTEKGENCY